MSVVGEESTRLLEARRGVPWKRWGPYLSERQWGTVREDYSEDGDAWDTTLSEVDALLARTDRLLASTALPSSDEPSGWVRPPWGPSWQPGQAAVRAGYLDGAATA